MKKLILILLVLAPVACFSQSKFKKGILVGNDIWVIDSVFIRNDSLIFQINDTIQIGTPVLSYYYDVDMRFWYGSIENEAWIEHRRRYFSN